MRVAIESTTKIVQVDGVPARIWEGTTNTGIPVLFYVTRVMPKLKKDDPENAGAFEAFERELIECAVPSAVAKEIPLNLIL